MLIKYIRHMSRLRNISKQGVSILCPSTIYQVQIKARNISWTYNITLANNLTTLKTQNKASFYRPTYEHTRRQFFMPDYAVIEIEVFDEEPYLEHVKNVGTKSSIITVDIWLA